MLSQRLDGMVGRASLNQPKERKNSPPVLLRCSPLSIVILSHSANGCAPGGKAYFAYPTSAVDSDSSTSLGCFIEFLLKCFLLEMKMVTITV